MGDYTRVTLGKDTSGRPLVLNQRTLDMFREVERRLGKELTIVQGSYRAGNGASASAGTHDGGGVLDVRTWNLTVAERNEMIRIARSVGFAAWYRTKAQGFDPHSHWVAIGDRDLPVSAENQVTQYKHGLNGLASYGDDDGPDGYRSMTWEKYKAAHANTGNNPNRPEEDTDMTPAQAAEMLALLRSMNATLAGMNARLGYVANDGMKDLDALRDKLAGND